VGIRRGPVRRRDGGADPRAFRGAVGLRHARPDRRG
jgi:hypothetical protein